MGNRGSVSTTAAHLAVSIDRRRDAQSALSCGVSPVKTKMIAFVTCSTPTGLAGIIVASYLSSVAAATAEGMEFETVAAAVIGGCSLRGGVGSIRGTILGVGTLMTLRAGLVMVGINIFLVLNPYRYIADKLCSSQRIPDNSV